MIFGFILRLLAQAKSTLVKNILEDSDME
jgi:hypothetical protein